MAESTVARLLVRNPAVESRMIGSIDNSKSRSGTGAYIVSIGVTLYYGHAYIVSAGDAASAAVFPINYSMGAGAALTTSFLTASGTYQSALVGGVWEGEDGLGLDNIVGDGSTTYCSLRAAMYRFKNSTTNTCSNLNVGATVYFEDGETVGTSKTFGPKAGQLVTVDSDGAWVDMTTLY